MKPSRTIALLGHRHAGKTSLGEHLLAVAGAVRSPGSVDAHSALLDHEAVDHKHASTQFGGVAWLDWREHRVHVLDTPGSEGLFHEQFLAMAFVDGGVVVVNATQGVEGGAVRVLNEAERTGLPCVAVVTRAAVGLDVQGLLDALSAEAAIPALPIVAPPGAAADQVARWRESLAEVVSLVDDVLLARYLDGGLDDATVRGALGAAVRARRVLPVVFFDTQGLAADGEATTGAEAVLDAVIDALPGPFERRVPVAVDSLTGEDVPVPPDGPFLAQRVGSRRDESGATYHILRVWSGEAPKKLWAHAETGEIARVNKVYSLRGPRTAIAKDTGPGALIATWDRLPGRTGDTFTDGARLVLGTPPWPQPLQHTRLLPSGASAIDRLPSALVEIAVLDPALDVAACELTGVPLLGTVGDDQLERALDVVRTRCPSFALAGPLVPYMEVPATAILGVEGVHQVGSDADVKEFGRVVVGVEPCEPDDPGGVVFTADEDALPAKFRAAITEGAARAARSGPLAGYAVAALRVTVVDGSYDILCTTDEHLAEAARIAVTEALRQTSAVLVEPWWRISVHGPADLIGPLVTEINARRGRVSGLEVEGRDAIVFADCPYRELRTFGPRLLALTGGRGRFTGRVVRYDLLPAALVKDAVQASPFR